VNITYSTVERNLVWSCEYNLLYHSGIDRVSTKFPLASKSIGVNIQRNSQGRGRGSKTTTGRFNKYIGFQRYNR
jgi:hypothetical protein